MYAQSLIDYSALTSAASSMIQELSDGAQDWAAHTTPMTWLVIGAVVLVGLKLWARR